MDKDIQRRVIGLLTATSNNNREEFKAARQQLLSDFLSIEYPLPEGDEARVAARATAQAVADGLKGPVTDLLVCFCAAFAELAEINDAGETEKKSSTVLSDLALEWEQHG